MAENGTSALSSLSILGGKLAPGITRALGSQFFDEIEVDSQVAPGIRLEPWAPGDEQPGTPKEPLSSVLGNWIRPRVRVKKGGEVVATFAPYGEPNGNWFPNAVGLGAGVAAVTAYLLGHRKIAVTLALVSGGGFVVGQLTRPK